MPINRLNPHSDSADPAESTGSADPIPPTDPVWPGDSPDWMKYSRSLFDEKFGLVVTEATAAKTSGWAPVETNTQTMGMWHGGASGVMIETLGSLAANIHAGPGKRAVGAEMNVTHHRPATEGKVFGTATALHLGRRLATYEVKLTNSEGKLVASGRITCAIVKVEH